MRYQRTLVQPGRNCETRGGWGRSPQKGFPPRNNFRQAALAYFSLGLFCTTLVWGGGVKADPQTPASDYPGRTGGDRMPPGRSNGSGMDAGTILLLIQTLLQTSNRTPQVDLTPDIAEIRGNLSRLYLLLANQYLLQKQLSQACSALESSYTAELESYLSKRLNPRTDSSDCHAMELTRLSQLTGSRTALLYPVMLRDRFEILAIVPPDSNTKGLFPESGNFQSGSTFKSGSGSTLMAQANSDTAARYVDYGLTAERFKQTLEEFRRNLLDPTSNDYLVQSKQLYNWMIRPIEPELQRAKIESLVFVMNGDLRVIPMAALHDGKQFFVEKYAVASVPTLPLTDTNKRDRSANLRSLGMGLSEAIQGFKPLPAARMEVEALTAKLIPGKAFLNEAFTIENLQNQFDSGNYHIIHLASHAEFSGRKPSDSFILFWNDRLLLNRISSLRLTPEILALSACQTALGANLGLSGVAVDSGAKSVLASLWSVSDLGTASLMLGFYRHLPGASSKAIALQKAQIAMLKKQVRIEGGKIVGIPSLSDANLSGANNVDLAHPYYWSAFILVGNWL